MRNIFYSITFLILFFYASFLTADFFTGNIENPYSNVLKFLCVVLCFLLSLVPGRDVQNRRDTQLLRAALFFTVIADLLIVVLGKLVPGIFIFMIVQALYIYRHSRKIVWDRRELQLGLSVYVLSLIALFAIYPVVSKSYFLVPTLIYSVFLSTSVWMGIGTLRRGYYPGSTAVFISAGMILFFLTDVNVAQYFALPFGGDPIFSHTLHFIGVPGGGAGAPGGSLSGGVHSSVDAQGVEIQLLITRKFLHGFALWIFYIPSQYLLALSVYNPEILGRIFGSRKEMDRALNRRVIVIDD